MASEEQVEGAAVEGSAAGEISAADAVAPEVDWEARVKALETRAKQAEAETEITRSDLNRKITALTLKLDAANQQLEAARAGSQAELDKLRDEVARLQADNARLKEDSELYKQVGDGQQEAVRKLMDRASQAQSSADRASRQAQSYILLVFFILLMAVAAVGICVVIVLKLLGY